MTSSLYCGFIPTIPLPNGVADRIGLEDRVQGTGEPLAPLPACHRGNNQTFDTKKAAPNTLTGAASLRLVPKGFQTQSLLLHLSIQL
jgi:hypothetical protein